jgi:putative transposase
MPNHYHLMLQQKVDGGISEFMQKIGTGYTMFFNAKYERDGVLFQGKYKYKEVKSDKHFLYLPHYIHLNPLPLLAPQPSHEGGPTSFMKRLELFRWSSLLDYLGTRNFPSITERSLLLDTYGGSLGYRKNLLQIMGDPKVMNAEIKDIMIESPEILVD